MKNILNERPKYELNRRLLESANFVADDDLRGKNVLDIGCGYGWFELNALSRGVGKITGVEISENDLKTAKENVVNERAEFRVGEAAKLPFESDFFDTVVCWEVVEHMPKNTEKPMFLEVKRVLRANGVFYLSTPNSSFFSNILDPAWWLAGHRHYTAEKLKKFAAQNFFKVLDIKIKGGLWSSLFILNMYISKWIFRRTPFFNDYFMNKENFEYKRNGGFVDIFIKFKKEHR